MSTTHDNNEETITLDSQANLLRFRAHFEEQFAECMEAASVLEEEVPFLVVIQAAKDAYQKMQAETEAAYDFLNKQNELSEEIVAAIQASYNDFAEAYFSLLEASALTSDTVKTESVGPLYAIEQKFNQLDSRLQKLLKNYESLQDKSKGTIASLTYKQALIQGDRINSALEVCKDTTQADEQTINFLKKESLEIERDVEHVQKSLAELAPELKEKGKSERPDLKEAFPERSLNAESIVTKTMLDDEEIKTAVKNHYSSVAAFDAALWRLVRKIEEPSLLDRFLGVSHGSIFKSVLKGMTVSEVEQFEQLSGTQIRTALEEMQIEDDVQYDYRTFVAWMDEFKLMAAVVEPHPEMLFEELLAIVELVKNEAAVTTD